MQEVINVGLSGPDCVEKKAEIKRIAEGKNMSISGFMLWLFEQYKARSDRKKAREEPWRRNS